MSTEHSLGEYLRSARVERGDSLRAFAEVVQIAPSYLSDIENDRRVPADDVLRKMGAALGRDFDELLARAGKLDGESERFIRKQPEAVRLFRRITEANLSADEIRKLTSSIGGPDDAQKRLNL